MGEMITPEQQIENVRQSIELLRRSPRQVGHAEAVRLAEEHLVELEAKDARGELEPLPDDGLPF
jgi:hypothetical protein